jgi:hypothetical protein
MVVQVKVDCLGYFHVPPPDLIAPTDADRQIISQVFSGNLICFGSGKLATKAKIEIADPWHYQADHNSSP